jgi:C-terminal processing protease CtpA/Prc
LALAVSNPKTAEPLMYATLNSVDVNHKLVVWIRAMIGLALMLLATAVAAQGDLTAERAAQDVRVLKSTLLALHPGLHKYQTPAQIDAAFARFETRGNAARDASEMYLAAAELAAAIRCGHTWASTYNMMPALRSTLIESANKLPFWLATVENRWLVIGSATDALKVGDEILNLNGVSASEIITKMLPYQRADGSSDGKRVMQLQHGRNAMSMMDVMWPLLSAPQNGSYKVEIKRSGVTTNVHVAATTIALRDAAINASNKAPKSSAWTFKIEDHVAVLTLPTFAFWNSQFDWNKFLNERFAELNLKKVPNLIIDIRANEGGNGDINSALLKHLLRAPLALGEMRYFSAYERAPYQLMKHLDTWNYGFFDRTNQVEKTTDIIARFLLKPTKNNGTTITPYANVYQGKTWVLIGAENSSATFQLAQMIQQSAVATLVGQNTGGNKRGLNSGQIAWVTLPNSGVAVDIPLLSAEPVEAQPDAGVVPDIVVKQTFAARAAGIDAEMKAVLKAIADRK